MVAVVYHGRALPIAWTWVRHARGHSTQTVQLALLSYVRAQLPTGVAVSLSGTPSLGTRSCWTTATVGAGAIVHPVVQSYPGLDGVQLEAIGDLICAAEHCAWRLNAALTHSAPHTTNLLLT